MFRLLINTTTRMIEARGLRQACAFVSEYLRNAPRSGRWLGFINTFCRRNLNTSAPLDLIQAGVWSASPEHYQRLRAHYDILGTYLSGPALGRVVLGRPLVIATFDGQGGAYRLDLMAAPAVRDQGELMLALVAAGSAEPVAWLSLRFAWCGAHRLALRLGTLRLSERAAAVEDDLHGMPAAAVLMDGVYAMVRTLGIVHVTAEPDGNERFWTDCGGLFMPDNRFTLPLQPVFWCSNAGREALGEAWVPQQMLRMELMSQANAAVASWLRFDETQLARGARSRALEANEN